MLGLELQNGVARGAAGDVTWLQQALLLQVDCVSERERERGRERWGRKEGSFSKGLGFKMGKMSWQATPQAGSTQCAKLPTPEALTPNQ